MNNALVRNTIGINIARRVTGFHAGHAGGRLNRSTRTAGAVRTGTAEGQGNIDSDSLARRIAARDTAALRELFDSMGRRAFGLAFTVIGDASLAEDAVQDAFMSLWRQAETVTSSRGRIESLLLTLVHRRAVDHVRKRARADRLTTAMEWDVSDDDGGDPEELALRHHDRAEVVDALLSLPSEQRTAIELAYFRGMTQREIADETDVSLGTVKGRMRLGLSKLRTVFGLNEEER